MRQELTEIVCVVDRSGSMADIREDAIGGFNQFLEDQRQVPGEGRLTLVLFDDEYDRVANQIPLAEMLPLDETTYVPRGTTALLDAVGRTIDDVGGRLSETPEAERPGHVIVAILTDGLENASTQYSHSQVKAMIDHQQKVYGWDFIYLGANQDALEVAESMAIRRDRAVAYEATGEGTLAVYQRMSGMVSESRAGAVGGAKRRRIGGK